MGVSNSAYARHRGVSEAAVRKAIKTGRIVKGADGTINPDDADRSWSRNTRPKRDNPPAPSGLSASVIETDVEMPVPDYNESKARKAFIDAEMALLDLDARRGSLVSAAQVEEKLFVLGRSIRNRLQEIPSQIADACTAESNPLRVENMIADAIDEALIELTGTD